MIQFNKDDFKDIILDLHGVVTIPNPYYVFKFIDTNKLYSIVTPLTDLSPTPQRYSQFHLDSSTLLLMHPGEAPYYVFEASTFTTDPSLLTLIWSDFYKCISQQTYVQEVYYRNNTPEIVYGENVYYDPSSDLIIENPPVTLDFNTNTWTYTYESDPIVESKLANIDISLNEIWDEVDILYNDILIIEASIASMPYTDAYIDGSLNLKTDFTYSVKQDNSINLKTSFTYVDTSLNAKGDVSYNTKQDASIGLKTDFTYDLKQDSSIILKSNLTYVDGSLAKLIPYTSATQDLSLNHHNITQVYGLKFDACTFINEPYRLAWDNDNGTLSYGLPDGGSIQINQEEFNYFTNLSGTNLVDGDIVCVVGATGNRLAITLTNASNPLSAQRCLGVITNGPIAPNNLARVTILGLVNDLNTDAYNEGDVIYADPSNNGKWTNVAPSYPNMKIRVGTIMVKHPNVGVLAVRVQSIVNDYIPITGGNFKGQLNIDASLRVGSTNDYLTIDTSGTLRLYGNATGWDDLRGPASGINPAGSPSAATPNINDGTLTFAKGNVATCWFQLPHNWLEGSDLHPHIHWCKDVSATGYVNWQIKTKWSNIGSVMPDFTALSKPERFVASDNNIAGTQALWEWADLNGTGKTFSSMVGIYLARISDASDNYTGNVSLYEIDLHYQVDSFGTNDEYAK